MRKRSKLAALVICMFIFLISTAISVSAASYPMVISTTKTSITIPEGEVGKVHLMVLPEYKNEQYHVEIYNSAGRKIAVAEDSYYNSSSGIRYFTILVDTDELNMGTGTYTIKYWTSFYSLYEWHDSPNKYTDSFRVIKNVCKGNHNLLVERVVSEGTCEKEATVKVYCTKCEFEGYEDRLADHTYGEWSKASDLTHKHTCSVCGYEETQSHNWNGGAITKQPTCAVTGVKTYTCNSCGGTKTETIAKTNDHSYGDWNKLSDSTHQRTCMLCGKTETASHSWNTGRITKRPNCAEYGEKTYTCSICDGTKTETLSKTEDHNYGSWTKLDDKSHQHSCMLCEKTEDEDHKWNAGIVTKQPNCAETGVKTYSCDRCEATKAEVMAKTDDHKYGNWIKVDNAAHRHICTLCEKEETADHNWDSGTITVAPTLETTGLRVRSCKDCNATKTEVVPKRANGDLNGDQSIDNKDVEYLLWYTLFPEKYPLDIFADFDNNGFVDNKDVEYLLWYTLFPEKYPLQAK